MNIRAVVKKNKGFEKEFVYHRLVESVRTPSGPRQRMLLNLGKLEIPQDEWKTLADRIEEILSGQEVLVKPARHIEDLAQHYAAMLINKRMQDSEDVEAEPEKEVKEWETVDLASITNSESRTVGGEALAHYAFESLGFGKLLSGLGFSKEQINQTELLLAGRLLYPGSEQAVLRWAKNLSAMGEVVGADFSHLSNNCLYRLSDALLEKKSEIEAQLAKNEKSLLGLEEKILLYDLTNSYLEGSPEGSKMAKRGRSKEKRSDCPLLTLALCLDEDGFPKGSRVFPGNVSEPATLNLILDDIAANSTNDLFSNPTVIIDAGIATKDNLNLMKEKNFNYICVSRNHPTLKPGGDFCEITTASGETVSVKKMEQDDEIFLYCRSEGRKAKETGMSNRFTQRFEDGLRSIEMSINNPKGRKDYRSIVERIGRLKEKCSGVARFYSVEVTRDGETATAVTWNLEKRTELESHFDGSYYIRTNRKDLTETEIWHLYVTLTRVESAFRSLKSDLGLRPNFHQKDTRMEGHLFITVLAYHLMAFLQTKLRGNGVNYSWQTIRTLMSSQCRITTGITTQSGKRLHIRQTTTSEDFHKQIHRALSLPPKPLRMKKTEL
ncbi:MAG: IS1634 family transposase [Firmicutes bacterium]|nr:IS1634 family transposase [Bacillota bacterium]